MLPGGLTFLGAGRIYLLEIIKFASVCKKGQSGSFLSKLSGVRLQSPDKFYTINVKCAKVSGLVKPHVYAVNLN